MENIKCIGAILGDTIGSIYENRIGFKEKIYPLFKDGKNSLSDDSILTLATMDYLLNSINKEDYYFYLKKWYNLYPNSRYGEMFTIWAKSDRKEGYNSKGNGALMRISPIVYYYDNLKEIKFETLKNVSTTHNSEEAITSSLIYVECLYFLKHKKDKEYIKEFLFKTYKINFDNIKVKNNSVFAFQTLLNSFYLFFNTNSLEELIENVILFNGDTDTILAITLSMGEFYYTIKKEMISHLFNDVIKKDQRIISLILEFNNYLNKNEKRE